MYQSTTFLLFLPFLGIWTDHAHAFNHPVPFMSLGKVSSCSNLKKIPVSRRFVLDKVAKTSASILTVAAWAPSPAAAKKEPVTRESISAVFASIRSEIDDTPFVDIGQGGGVKYLEGAIEKKEWEKVKEFTKFYDLEFRKAKMSKAKKMMPDKEMKSQGTQLCNNVTFDLIGINRAARVEDVETAHKYLGELKEDILEFLKFEEKIVLE
mmetsp:Transcript_25161/g.37009  ORF Transcript_25161/g.37009 Transcript_25161/m.37009 type:complete len:209 (+) Transcript_25161:26-652(+)|eukprot:CAMPEP_0195530064 /NCGR_PEP_ID=MMETSP0794_2-20130614/32808_1 /TAXON_ID=515487 /ORGANISM="Stephanopyxis turris, Strain CCMP 815" /LENGTH=208 /DNA_ID=CAMNT_0040661477 /DNA_START=25 /DNA_END=651 /DNA_ORIENTATION=-